MSDDLSGASGLQASGRVVCRAPSAVERYAAIARARCGQKHIKFILVIRMITFICAYRRFYGHSNWLVGFRSVLQLGSVTSVTVNIGAAGDFLPFDLLTVRRYKHVTVKNNCY